MKFSTFFATVALLVFTQCGTETTESTDDMAIEPATTDTTVFRASGFSDYQDGDLLFIADTYNDAVLLGKATHDTWNQVGMVFHKQDGSAHVLESYAKVRLTPIENFKSRSIDGKLMVKRLNVELGKSKDELLAATKPVFMEFRGKFFDLSFNWSDDALSSAELIWKLFDRGFGVRLCEPGTFGDLDFSSPFWTEQLAKEYGTDIPLDTPVLRVEALMNSSQLFTVHEI